MSTTKELQRHEMYKDLSRHTYKYGIEPAPKGAIPLYIHENKKNGFWACAYKYQDRIVIAFRGTEFKSRDTINDAYMLFRNIPDQTTDAIYFVKQMQDVIKRDYPGYKLDLTGHSLGGSLAQYCHVLVDGINESITFHPFGTAGTLRKYFSQYPIKNSLDRIINYCNKKDFISGKFSNGMQIGRCYEIKVRPEYKDTINLLNPHFLEKMEPLSTRVYRGEGYQPVKQNFTGANPHAGSEYQTGCFNPDFANGHVNSYPSTGCFDSHQIINYLNSHQANGCAGSYPVSGYTRDDGTKVNGYIRTCGAKHKNSNRNEFESAKAKYANKKFQDIPPEELEKAISYFI